MENDEIDGIKRKIANGGPFVGQEITHHSTPEKTSDPNKVAKLVDRHRAAGGKIIYEVGCGGLFCVNLGGVDLSVGVDPAFSAKANTKGLEGSNYSERILFNQKAAELPNGYPPDFVVMVAPSPEMLERILDELQSKVNKKTKFAVFIENQSDQAVNGEAERMVARLKFWLRMMDKKVQADTDVVGLDGEFSGYLEDLGLKNGGELKTTPWEGAGDWMVVTGV